jgi:hypothetical protein
MDKINLFQMYTEKDTNSALLFLKLMMVLQSF